MARPRAGRIPGPVSRFLREGTGPWVAGLLSIALLLSAALTGRADLVLGQTLDRNWRGAYDLLVAAPGAEMGQCRESGQSLIAPNFVGNTPAASLTLEQLEAVRAVDGVEVAAPIGLVGSVNPPAQGLVHSLPLPQGDETIRYVVNSEVTIDDGVQPRAIATNEFRVSARPGGGDPEIETMNSEGHGSSPEGITVDSGMVDLSTPTIVAVDPAAERELLGESGAFLDPLIFVSRFDTNDLRTLQEDKLVQDILLADLDLAYYPNLFGPVTEEDFARTSFVPLLLNNDPVQRVELTTTATPLAPAERLVQAEQSGPPVSETHNVSGSYIPFAAPAFSFPVPGSGGALLEQGYIKETLMGPVYPAPPTYRSVDSESCQLRIEPRGWVDSTGAAVTSPSEHDGYLEQTYREQIELEPPARSAADHVTLPYPIGRFSPEDLRALADATAYVPLGYYEKPRTLLVGEDINGAPGSELRPGLSGRGLMSPAAGALTTLEGGQQMRGDAFIDAVRVRVAGVEAYDDEGRAKVGQVSQKLTEAGFDVTVVAGASPQMLPIFVPEYSVVDGQPNDLGWVRQDWTALNAAARVESSVDSTGLSLVLFTFGSGLLLSLLTAVREARHRRAELRLLRDLGWTRARRLWWLGSPSVIGTVLVAICAAAAVVILRSSESTPSVPWFVYPVVPILFGAIGLASVVAAERSDARRQASRSSGSSLPLTSPFRFGMVSAGRQLVDSIMVLISLAVAGLGVGLSVMTVYTLSARAGASRLAERTLDDSLQVHVALVGVVLVLTVLFFVLLHRAGVAPARTLRSQLASLGWARPQITGWAAGETLPVVVVALLFTSLAAWGLAQWAAAPVPLLVISSTVTTLLGGLLLGIFKTRRTA